MYPGQACPFPALIVRSAHWASDVSGEQSVRQGGSCPGLCMAASTVYYSAQIVIKSDGRSQPNIATSLRKDLRNSYCSVWVRVSPELCP